MRTARTLRTTPKLTVPLLEAAGARAPADADIRRRSRCSLRAHRFTPPASTQNPRNAPTLMVFAELLPPTCASLLVLLPSASSVRFFVSE
jgi:hypothetical protein